MVAAILAGLGVGLGAFGAHALSARFGDYEKGIWQTAVFYHLVHALALFAYAVALQAVPGFRGIGGATAVAWLFPVGVLFFSGSLYALALSGIKILGAVTPIGGVCFLVAWTLVARMGYVFHQVSQGSGTP